MSFTPFISGLAGTLVAAVYLSALVAVGTFFIREDDDPVSPIGSLLVGAGIAAYILAIGSALGWVKESVVILAVCLVIVLVMRWQHVRTAFLPAYLTFSELADGLLSRIALWSLLLMMWVIAMAPPHTSSALRYHLAHARQLLNEGLWTRVADFYYAVPFGWSILFVPLEWIGLPQGARLMSFGLYLMTVGALLRAVDLNRRMALAAAVFFFVQPAVIDAFTSATANAYALTCMLAMTVTLMRKNPTVARSMLGGFIIWIGIQSRYQIIGAAVIATILWFYQSRTFDEPGQKRVAFTIGAMAAFALASPFYVANLKWFGNPVWPLFISPESAAASYDNLVAFNHNEVSSGWINGLSDDVNGSLAMIAFLVIAALIAGAASKEAFAKRGAVFGALFVVGWVLVQPFVFMQFILMWVPVAAFTLAFAFSQGSQQKPFAHRMTAWAMAIGIPFIIAANLYISRGAFRYFVSGDLDKYHERTGFYRTYAWVNKHAPEKERFVTIVRSGLTYYLDRPYRRADPMVGGQVDWNRISNGKGLVHEMASRGFDAIIFEDRDWRMWPGGVNLHNAISDAIATGELVEVHRVREPEYDNLTDGSATYTDVLVLVRPGHWADT